MRLSLPARLARLALAAGLAFGLIGPAAVPVAAADPLVLKIGTTQDLDSLNPFQTALLLGYEIFTLNYDLLVGFGPNNEPVAGFAESWSPSADGKTWTFKIREGMKWSDGKPATAADAAFSINYVLNGVKADKGVGYGYLNPYVKDAAITSVTAPDATTLVIETSRPNDRVLSMFVPILPEHVWKSVKLDQVADYKPPLPIVGTGPYQVVEWQTGQFARLERNPNYWGKQGAADSIVFQFFPDAADTMVQAFKNSELDYIRNPSADAFNQLKTLPGATAIASDGNGFTQINYNTYEKDIPDGGASTKALRDPAFRSALGYAIDKKTLVDRVLAGYGVVGTTQVPVWQHDWHVEPNDVRPFSIDTANQKLTEAGYLLDSNGRRLDKQGKPITLRLDFPNTDPAYGKDAEFVQGWLQQLGIKVQATPIDEDALSTKEYLDSTIPLKGQLDYDLVIWGWVGDPDPQSLLQILTTDAIGDASDTQWSNARYDELYKLQTEATSKEERKTYMTEMQQLMYDQAPYEMLYYDNELHVYRSDKFAGWQTQPLVGGTPFFQNGPINYTLLTDAKAAPSPTPTSAGGAVASGPATPNPTAGASPTDTTSSGSNIPPLIIGIVALAAVILGAVTFSRRRAAAGASDDDE